MEKLDKVLKSPTFRRFAVWAVTFGVLALNKKFDLNFDAAEIAGLVAVSLGWTAQSAVRQGKAKPAESDEEALAILAEKSE